MNLQLKNILLIAAKHAVAAVLTNGALMAMFSGTFNFHDLAGVLALLKLTGAIVGGAEAKVWIPKLLNWATTTS
jgi:hypothetical protein